ncbi:MAG TPA: response regulator transcription factor [Chitinispirillaceae bacterium]|nr:response regulator transcription factor [Chitinispirillaceae bacterium]
MNEKILVIDDDTELTSLLHDYLGNNGFVVSAVDHPEDGLALIEKEMPDAIILDIMLPDMDGFTVCKEIRKKYTVPILMLTAKGDVQDRIVGLEIGADDYLAKPFEPRELVARLRSILRRLSDGNADEHIGRFGDLVIDFAARNARIGDTDANLTTNEYLLLEHLVHNKGRVLDRNQLVDYLRGIDWESSNRSIDMLISRIRQKLNDDSRHPLYIRTVTGTGYVFIGKR